MAGDAEATTSGNLPVTPGVPSLQGLADVPQGVAEPLA
jgi:hypothetical protein